MTKPLFFSPTIMLEKVAYSTRIEDSVEEWPTAVTREAYKQLPFLKAYETEVELDKVDSSRGYGVGKMLVWPARMEKGAAAREHKLITVPIILRDRELSPLDVYSHRGRMLPMDQEKVATFLFRPDTFESQKTPLSVTGNDLFRQLSPPDTGHQYAPGSMGKSASAGHSILDALRHTFRYEDVQGFGEKIASDVALRQIYTSNPKLVSCLQSLSHVKEKTASTMREDRLARTAPTVVQISKRGGSYSIKQANHTCYAPQEAEYDRFYVQSLMSKQAFAQLGKEGRVTLSVGAPESAGTMKLASVAGAAGQYKVYAGSYPVEGFIVPHVVDFGGNPLGYQIFSGGNVHAMQEKIAGVRIAGHPQTNLRPRGQGVFVYQDGERAVAYEPVEVITHSKVAGVSSMSCVRLGTGERIRITYVPGLQKVAFIGNEVSLPTSMWFLPLHGESATKLASTPESMDVLSHRKTASSSVTLVSDGSCYSFRGAGASAFSQEILDEDQAEFALCAMGVTGQEAYSLLKTASRVREVPVHITRHVRLETSRSLEALEKVASARVSTKGIRVDLTKELALLSSPAAETLWKTASVVFAKDTSDAILSLGFVTPENASIYVNYLPDLEKVSSKLAELLVASRLGMDDVRESSARNAMTQVNTVIRGLESLKSRIQ